MAECHCLQESGVVHMASLAQRFSLAGDLLQSVIEPRIGESIKGRLQAGLLFTPAYISRIKAQVLLLRFQSKSLFGHQRIT